MQKKPQQPCPGCGAFARVYKDGHSVCAYCGASLPPLPFSHPTARYPNPTPIEEGMRAKIGGKDYVAVGRVLFREIDDEGSVSTWDEWVLSAQDGDTRFLEYDAGKWSLSGPIDRDLPFPHAASEGGMVSVDGQMRAVTSAGYGEVTGVSGQIPWPIEIGERVRYVDLGTSGDLYSVEDGPDGPEWYRGRRLEDAEVFTLFGLTKLATRQVADDIVRSDRRGFGCLTMLLAIASLVLWGVALGQNGKNMASGSAVASQIAEDGQRFGPFPLTQANRVHRLRLSTSGITQTSVFVQAILEDDQGPLTDADGEFWDESGYDEGNWHEWSLESYQDFQLKKPGNYYVRLVADPEAAATGAQVAFRIEQGVLYTNYFAWFGFVGLLLGGVFLIAGSPGVGKKVWDGMETKR